MPKPELEFFEPIGIPWTPVEPVRGLDELVLARDEATQLGTRLLRFASGTDTTPLGPQRHDFWEEIWFVSGSLHDLSLDRTFHGGMYACRPPGMPHGPWRSDGGAVLFEVRYR